MARKAYPDGVTELEFAVEASTQDDVLSLLFGDGATSWVPEAGFLGTICAGHGVRRRTLYLRTIVSQEPGWVRNEAVGLTFAPQYFSRAITTANHESAHTGILIVHSHPGPSRANGATAVSPIPSGADLRHERELLCAASRALRPDSPVAAGIVEPGGGWRIREYWWPRPTTPDAARSVRFGSKAGLFLDATGARVVGQPLLLVQRPATGSRLRRPEHDSTNKLWGDGGETVLASLRVGVAGAGGVGSILCEYLSRLGVGAITVVDYDQLKTENLNRSQGARRQDVGKPKVRYLERLMTESATNPRIEVDVTRSSVVEWEGLRPLLDCDLILNAADDPFARQVLDCAAYAYRIPLIDGGTIFQVTSTGEWTGRSQVSESGPCRPCLECQGVYTREEATLARETPRQQGPNRYVVPAADAPSDVEPRAPSVIAHNALVASLMIQRLIRTVLLFPPRTPRFQQRFYVETGDLRWGPTTQCLESCAKQATSGLGDDFSTPIGVDPRWAEMRPSRRGTVRASWPQIRRRPAAT